MTSPRPRDEHRPGFVPPPGSESPLGSGGLISAHRYHARRHLTTDSHRSPVTYVPLGILLMPLVYAVIGLLPGGVIPAARRSARMPARLGGGSRMVMGRCWLRGMCKEGGAGYAW